MQVLRVGLLAAAALALTIAGSQPLPKQFNGYQPLTTMPVTTTGSSASTGLVPTTVVTAASENKQPKKADNDCHKIILTKSSLEFWTAVNDVFTGSYYIDVEASVEVVEPTRTRPLEGNERVDFKEKRVRLNSKHNSGKKAKSLNKATFHNLNGKTVKITLERGVFWNLPDGYPPPNNKVCILVDIR